IGAIFGQATMPDVVNMSQEDAMQALEEVGIASSQIQVEEEANDAVEKGHVIASDIKAGESVSENETVTLTICKGPTFLVPDYTGQYISDVEEQLKEEGLNIEIEVEEKPMADTNPGYILEQKGLTVGSRIDPDEEQTITFVVAAYPQVTISQDWIGQSYQSVYRELNAMGIAVVQSGSGSTIVNVSPAVGSIYTQEGSNSYITLYTE
ncbi:MAG: PASTA domain-containing protein, partial [Erysipelotrichaceae bacterium]|nr:PASTA domain-containing protein [Erysipelotrichaceae bacterium]